MNQAKASGQLQRRMELTLHRLLQGTDPAFTQDFILADVILNPDKPRRFDDFSGDLSGRVVEVLAVVDWMTGDNIKWLDALVDQIVSRQLPDGRFGRADLSFDSGQLDREHMALLWGNGRLLVGLMTYHTTRPRVEVLKAAVRLGEFLIRVCDGLNVDELNQKLATAGAYGFICLTQCNEGLAMLYRATRDQRWLDLGLRVSRWLAPRGTQHSHGLLTTLRGRLMLYEFTGDRTELAATQELFDDIIRSRVDRLVFGGVPEYFGGLDNEQVKSRTGGYVRVEGCSEADFVRLCLQLWRGTGDITYLEHAEHCFLNHLLANQFANGDFGSRVLSRRGFWPSESPGRAWWCCTMHGLRAFTDVLDSVVTRVNEDELRINLFLDARWSDGLVDIDLEQCALDRFRISVRRAPSTGVRISARRPSWSRRTQLSPAGPLMAGQTVEVTFEPITRWVTRDGEVLSIDRLSETPIEAALFHGPWLMGASASNEPMFFSEPSGGNVVRLGKLPEFSWHGDDVSVTVPYQHDGYVQSQRTTMHWAGGSSRNAGGAFAVWLRYQSPASAASSPAPASR